MNATDTGRCVTCYGSGEIVSEQGPVACPHCFGDGGAISSGARVEWRLREIERLHRGSGLESEADVLWLVHELRRSREALLGIVTLCQDAPEGDSLALDIKYRANEVLALYEPRSGS
jgi:hypothetical protein